MLDSWMQTFRSYSDGAKGSTVDRSLNGLKPIMEIIGCLSRNTTPTERTLKAIKMVDNNEGPGKSLEHLNDCLLVKSYIAQDKTLLADGSCTFYAQFVQNWTSRYGRRWCSRKNFRADRGKTHKTYESTVRFQTNNLHNMMWKFIARLCTKYKQGGMKDQKAFTGEDLTKLQEKRHGRIDDFSAKQTQYVTHHTERGPEVERRKLQERQRTKGTRWCQPATQAVTKAKAKARPSNHRSLQGQEGRKRSTARLASRTSVT